MTPKRHRFLRNKTGATALEYAFITMLVALVIVTSLTLLGEDVSNSFSTYSERMDEAQQ